MCVDRFVYGSDTVDFPLVNTMGHLRQTPRHRIPKVFRNESPLEDVGVPSPIPPPPSVHLLPNTERLGEIQTPDLLLTTSPLDGTWVKSFPFHLI